LLVLTIACLTMSREDEAVRLPAGGLPRPPQVRETPTISVQLSRRGDTTVAGEAVADGNLAAVWQREAAAVRVLGFQPSQAVIVVHAVRDLPTGKVQQVIEAAQQAGFQQCVLRSAEAAPSPSNSRGPKP
jgi:biopolymer transport protein ExbD